MSNSFVLPTPKPPISSSIHPTALGPTFSGFPQLDQPRGLTPPFVAPSLIVPIDSSDPNKIIGNSYSAQISPTRSTLFVFDVPASLTGVCNLVLAFPPAFNPQYMAPLQINSPGGIAISRLDRPATVRTSATTTAGGKIVGTVPGIQSGNKYTVARGPCATGERIGYKADSLDGLDINFFQMTLPTLGLFLETSPM